MLPVCPKCDQALHILEFKDVEIDLCPQCKGVWLDAGEVERIVEKTGAPPDNPLVEGLQKEGEKIKGRKFLCPRCDRTMRQIQLGQTQEALVLERCPAGDGIWFDENELQGLFSKFSGKDGVSKPVEFLNQFFGG